MIRLAYLRQTCYQYVLPTRESFIKFHYSSFRGRCKMTSTDAKVLGGIGSLLILLTAVPNVGWVLGIAGFAMTLIAIRKISREYNDKEIWRNMLVAVTLAVGAIATGVITAVGGIFRV